ncbi:hypothetical protein V0288_18300 [Pannus brasiliensis CCIBt3594]|uniref:DUF2235 domain-containing protein n=1 Tax=Pannus brasiliensis CCIBt3594 TaxID=1427578 RepID=A0AAW9QYX3_9CHRO
MSQVFGVLADGSGDLGSRSTKTGIVSRIRQNLTDYSSGGHPPPPHHPIEKKCEIMVTLPRKHLEIRPLAHL